MNVKFQRSCKLVVGLDPDTAGDYPEITVAPELTVDFHVRRDMMASAQEATFRVYNLNQQTRDKIFKDRNTFSRDASGKAVLRRLRFYAGYGAFQPLIFDGYVRSATSYRDKTDFITEIEGYDGGMDMAYGFTTMVDTAPSISRKDAIKLLSRDLPGISGEPVIGEFPAATDTQRGRVYVGNTWELLRTYTDDKGFIDNGRLIVLQDNEAIEGEVPVISAASGLLGSPRRGENRMEVPMLFEPRFTLGQVVSLQSETWDAVNRTYRVAGFVHKGTISPAVAGDCRTDVLLYGPAQFLIVAGKQVIPTT